MPQDVALPLLFGVTMTDQQQAADSLLRAIFEDPRRRAAERQWSRMPTAEIGSPREGFLAGAAWQREQTPDVETIARVIRSTCEFVAGAAFGIPASGVNDAAHGIAQAVRDLLDGDAK